MQSPNSAHLACRLQQALHVDLDHDGREDCLRWVRCGPPDPVYLPDGGIGYPKDTLTLTTTQSGSSWELYDNGEQFESESLDQVTALHFGAQDERLLVRVRGYGTGNIEMWSVLDIFQNAVRTLPEPPLDDAFARLLRADEHVGKQYEHGVEVTPRGLELAWLVYRPDDPNCCPTGGLIKARLTLEANGLHVAEVWRQPEKQ